MLFQPRTITKNCFSIVVGLGLGTEVTACSSQTSVLFSRRLIGLDGTGYTITTVGVLNQFVSNGSTNDITESGINVMYTSIRTFSDVCIVRLMTPDGSAGTNTVSSCGL